MRLLVISNYFPPFEIGGWEQIAADVCEGLRARGHEVRVLTSDERAGDLRQAERHVERSLRLESPDRFRYHLADTFARPLREAANRATVERHVRDFGPDVIFINGMWNLPHCVAATAERLRTGRVAYYMASYWPAEPDLHEAFWRDIDPDSRRHLLKRLARTLVRPFFLRGAPRNRLDFAEVLCVSEYLRERLCQDGALPRDRTCVVHNGVELDRFTPAETPVERDAIRLLYVGTLLPAKGLHTVLEALLLLREVIEGGRVALSVYGAGSPDYEQELSRLVEENELGEIVRFRGFVPREAMPAVYRRHDVLVVPSIWPEPLARTLQEGMASGLVVIATTTGGTPEALRHGENGLAFQAGNARGLADALLLALHDRELRQRLSREARRTVEERFDLERMVDEIERRLAALASRPPAGDG